MPERIIYEYIWGEQTSEELEAATAKFDTMASAGKPPVHFIVDARQLTSVPLNMGALRENLRLLRHPSRGWVLYIDSHRAMLNFLAEIAARLLDLKFHHVKSLDDALTFLRQHDPTIRWDEADHSITAHKE